MKTVNSISGGKTSAYIAANYPADLNQFALVTTNDKNCLFPDKKMRQIVSDKIGREFIGTLEEDMIIYTILDLEQFIGKEIKWLVGKTFEEVIIQKKTLPNVTQRFCTVQMKLVPMQKFWYDEIREPVECRIGFRANEMRRAKNMLERTDEEGFLSDKFIIGNHKNGNNKWKSFKWQKPVFPLIEDGIFKDEIEQYWKDKPVRFAYLNNCVGCFHRSNMLLKHMSIKEPLKFNWFSEIEKTAISLVKEKGGKRSKYSQFKSDITYDEIKKHKSQMKLFDDDFNECDSGYCGL